MSNSQSLPPSTGLRWFKPSSKEDELIVRSPLDWWYSHWDGKERRSRRCAQGDCALCAEGHPVVLRYVLLVEDKHGGRWWLELRDRQRDALDIIARSPEGLPGAIIVVRRVGQADNQRVTLEWIGRCSTVPVDISRFVATLGLPAIKVERAQGRRR